jgi:tetratricopeptide (TPR) repeat protein
MSDNWVHNLSTCRAINALKNLSRNAHVPVVVLIALLAAIAYHRLACNEFINFDNNIYILGNSQLQKPFDADSLRWSFKLDNGISYWHPLTWLSLFLDYQLFGLQPAGYHLENLVIHIVNSALLFYILNKITGRLRPSFFVALLFALHPINVETVAWAIERKTLLSSLFWMLSIVAYIRYVERPAVVRYLVIMISMGMGLMAKPLLVSLPLIFLLLDVWPLARLRSGVEGWVKLLAEKIPLLLLSGGSVLLSIMSHQAIGQTPDLFPVPVALKAQNAIVSSAAYIYKLIWPVDLAIYYPPVESYPFWQPLIAAIFMSAVTWIAIRERVRRPWLTFGWSWYLVTLAPVSGLLRDGLWPEMADRFAYLPFVGLYVVVVWGCAELSGLGRRWQAVVSYGSAGLIPALMVGVSIQTGYWKDSVSLFGHALQVTGGNGIVFGALGDAYLQKGDFARSLDAYAKEREYDPTSSGYDLARGRQLLAQGDPASAMIALGKAHEKQQGDLAVLYYLGYAAELTGADEAAVSSYSKLLVSRENDTACYRRKAEDARIRLVARLDPGLDSLRATVAADSSNQGLLLELAMKLDRYGLYPEALRNYLLLEKSGSGGLLLMVTIANTYNKVHNYSAAAHYYEKALALSPSNMQVMNELGLMYCGMKRYEEAVALFRKAISVENGYDVAWYNLATTYLAMRNIPETVNCLRSIQRQFPSYRDQIAPLVKELKKRYPHEAATLAGLGVLDTDQIAGYQGWQGSTDCDSRLPLRIVRFY